MRAWAWLSTVAALSLHAVAASGQPATPEPPPPIAPVPLPRATKPEAPRPEAPTPEAPTPEAPTPEAPKSDAPKPEAGYLPGEGFFLRSSDDAFKLRLRLQSAIRAQLLVNGKARFTQPFLTLRPIASGNLYKKWIRFWTSLELAANPVYLLDSYVEIQPLEELALTVGQMSTPFSRHEYVMGPHQLLLPDWNQVANYFWTGRDKGAMLWGSLFQKKFDWAVGTFLGTPLRQFEHIRGNYLVVARFAYNPLGPVGGTEFAYAEKDDQPFRFSVAVNGFTSKLRQARENFNPTTFQFDVVPSDTTTVNHGLGADAFIQSSRVMGLVEGYYRRSDPRNGQPNFTSLGAFAQIGVLLYKRDVDVAVRGTWADPNVDTNDDRTLGIEVGGSYYIHLPEIALKLRYGYGDQKAPPVSGTGAGNGNGTTTPTAGGAPLPLAPGHIHVITAQINTAF